MTLRRIRRLNCRTSRHRLLVAIGMMVLTAACDMAGGAAGDRGLGGLPGTSEGETLPIEAEGNPPSEPVVAAGLDLDDEEARSIRDAAVAYVRDETAIEDVAVEIDAVSEGWARARVLPTGELTDPATLYLREESGRWRGVVIGTAFAPDDLDELGVAAGVRP